MQNYNSLLGVTPRYSKTLGIPSGASVRPTKISGYKQAIIPQMTPEQQNILSSLLGAIGPGAEEGLGYLSQLAGGEEGALQQFEGPARQMFERQIENLGNRFSLAGARGSSAFQNALAGAGAEFSENLAAQRAALQTSAIESLLGHAETLLGQRPFEQLLLQKARRPSGFGGFLGKAGGIGLGILGKSLLGI